MSRILLIGGYGGFGARLARRLAAGRHQVLVAGRNAGEATAFCATLPNAEPVLADRASGIGMVMARHRPDLVIDAAGPFQASGYTVPEACIAMRIPYLDLADGRDFVEGVAALDRDARAAGVAVIAGASSVPGLSGAVARKLAEGLDRIDSLDMAISASNRASAGASVAAAILGYVGLPVRLWRGKRWTTAYGWQEMRRTDFTLADDDGLRGRLTAIADVPDLGIAPDLLPGRPSVTFRAGTELGFQMCSLWLASWPVRWGWISSLSAWQRWLLPLYRKTLGLGSDRSAMHVTLKGAAGDRLVERRWTLIASQGDGPEIPVLAAELLAQDLLAASVAPGARHAWGELTFDRFEPLFAALAIRHETVERDLPPPLYARAMGPAFATLPPLVRAMHQVNGDGGAEGEGTVTHGTNPIARAAARLMGMPKPGSYPVHVHFAERDGTELWTRDFGGQRFTSELGERPGGVTERFGPIRFAFDLPGDASGLHMVFRGWSLFGILLPRFLAPCIDAREWQENDRFRYRVEVTLPLFGRAILYQGWLRPLAAPAAMERLRRRGAG